MNPIFMTMVTQLRLTPTSPKCKRDTFRVLYRILKSNFNEWGGLDEGIFLGHDDLDLSWRLREKGYWLRLALDVYINHPQQVSFNTLPKSYTNKLLAESSDVLFEKMRQYYHPKKVPDPRIYFGIGWWQPTILQSKSPEKVFESDLLPCPYEDIIPTV